MVGIIGAMRAEVEALKAEITGKKTEVISGIEFISGSLCKKEVVVAQCGIGKVFAAMCAEIMILKYGVGEIINTGVAGSLCKDLHMLDFAISDAVVQHDMDTTAVGDLPGFISGIDIVEIPASKRLCECVKRVAGEEGFNAKVGVIASGDQFINSATRKTFIHNTFGAVACEMEGAAIGQVCYVNKVDFVAIRCISDNASGDTEVEYPQMVREGALKSQKLVEKIVAKL